MRKAFTAEPGKTLVVADYGQLELRLLAHMANCASMLQAFRLGGDFHSRTALGMYDHIKAAIDRGTPPFTPLFPHVFGLPVCAAFVGPPAEMLSCYPFHSTFDCLVYIVAALQMNPVPVLVSLLFVALVVKTRLLAMLAWKMHLVLCGIKGLGIAGKSL